MCRTGANNRFRLRDWSARNGALREPVQWSSSPTPLPWHRTATCIADRENGRIQWLTSDGSYRGSTGGPGVVLGRDNDLTSPSEPSRLHSTPRDGLRMDLKSGRVLIHRGPDAAFSIAPDGRCRGSGDALQRTARADRWGATSKRSRRPWRIVSPRPAAHWGGARLGGPQVAE